MKVQKFTEEEKEKAKIADLIILPDNIDGTRCENCMFFKNNYCSNEKMKMIVLPRQCCAYWDAEGVIRVYKTNESEEDINENKNTLETGAVSPEVNSLILYTDNTKELAELRDKIYTELLQVFDKSKDEQGRLNILKNNFRILCSKAVRMYEKEMQEKISLTSADIEEYVTLYTEELYTWMREHKNDKTNNLNSLIKTYLGENKNIKMTPNQFKRYIFSEANKIVLNHQKFK